MSARRRRQRSFVTISKRQLAGLGIVGIFAIAGGLNATLDLAEKIARLAHGSSPSGKPIDPGPSTSGPYIR